MPSRLTLRSTGRAGSGLLLGNRHRGAPVTLVVRPDAPDLLHRGLLDCRHCDNSPSGMLSPKPSRACVLRAVWAGADSWRGKSAYLLRCARFGGSWFMQALLLFGVGWIAVGGEVSLADSPYFLVLWAVVIPILGGAALFASLYALARWCWIRWFEGERSKHRVQA